MFGFWQGQIDRELRLLRRLETGERATVRDQPLRAERPCRGLRSMFRLGMPEGVPCPPRRLDGEAGMAAGTRDHTQTGMPVAVAPGRCE